MNINTKGLSPILCKSDMSSRHVHHHYFGCPSCGNEVGGFSVSGNGENDWGTHQDKFCNECGQKIDWSNTNWFDIYNW